MIERIKARAKLIRPLLVPLVFYIGLLFLSLNWLESNPDSNWRIPVALTPMIPGTFIAMGIVRAIQQVDEMERLILLEGLAVSFTGTLILVLSMGFLGYAGVQQLNGAYIALFMTLFWLVGKLWVTRRYE
jgi:hypothetical protein